MINVCLKKFVTVFKKTLSMLLINSEVFLYSQINIKLL